MATSIEFRLSTRPTRRFDVEQNLRFLEKYESSATPEASWRGAVARGLYSPHISAWRHRRDAGDENNTPDRKPRIYHQNWATCFLTLWATLTLCMGELVARRR